MCYASDDKYEKLVNVLESNFQRAGVLDMSNAELLRILEDVMSYVPSVRIKMRFVIFRYIFILR